MNQLHLIATVKIRLVLRLTGEALGKVETKASNIAVADAALARASVIRESAKY